MRTADPTRPRRRTPGHLVGVATHRGFARLLTTRLAGQFGDGVFTASLAGAVLFNPERQAQPAQIAAGFAVLLLPYSVIGPFAGVLLDRWSRQRVLSRANVVRAAVVLVTAVEIAAGVDGAGFYATALAAISLGRFVLSALSAALPHVVDADDLVTANALSTTAGTIAAAVGGAAALGAKALVGDTDTAYATVAAAAAVPYLLAALVASRIARGSLGPSAAQRAARESAAAVVRGLRAGARAVLDTPPVRNGLAVVAVHRVCYGTTLVCTVLLYRNHFHADGLFRSGLAGLSQVVIAIAIGGGLAAFVTPAAFRRVGSVRWPAGMLVIAAAGTLALVLPYRLPSTLAAALLGAFVAQSVKISVDTLVQQGIDDGHRGRVFALYDMIFNLALVAAATLTALVLPADGRSPVSVIVVAAGYVVTAIGYVIGSARTRTSAR